MNSSIEQNNRGADWSAVTPAQLTESFLQSSNPNTAEAYRIDLAQFCDFLGTPDYIQGVLKFCDMPAGAAQRTAEDYSKWLQKRGYSANTVRRRLGSLRGLAAKAYSFTIITWSLRVPLPSANLVRDTSGPTRQQVLDMIDRCQDRDDAKGARDKAILGLMFFAGLRAAELLSIDIEHYDQQRATVKVKAKARWDRETVHMALAGRDAIDEWIEYRGEDPGPLFVTLESTLKAQPERCRLTYGGLYSVIGRVAKDVGTTCRPHGLRHAAATELLRLTNGNLIKVMKFLRHKNPQTTLNYIDSWKEPGRDMAEILSAGHPVFR